MNWITWLQLFFVTIGVGFLGLEFITEGIFVLFFTGILYLVDTALKYLQEESTQ